MLVGRDNKTLLTAEAAVKAINPSIQTLVFAADISSASAVTALFTTIQTTFNRQADILVNNAAANSGAGTLHEVDPDEWWLNFEVNAKGAFLLTSKFISSLPDPFSTPATIINLVAGAAWLVVPHMSGYSLSKLAGLQLMNFVAATYPNVTAVALHPGLVETDMYDEAFRRFNLDSPALVGGTTVWLAGQERAKFLSGRAVVANWSVEDLVERREEIVSGELLKMGLKGEFGKEQFE